MKGKEGERKVCIASGTKEGRRGERRKEYFSVSGSFNVLLNIVPRNNHKILRWEGKGETRGFLNKKTISPPLYFLETM